MEIIQNIIALLIIFACSYAHIRQSQADSREKPSYRNVWTYLGAAYMGGAFVYFNFVIPKYAPGFFVFPFGAAFAATVIVPQILSIAIDLFKRATGANSYGKAPSATILIIVYAIGFILLPQTIHDTFFSKSKPAKIEQSIASSQTEWCRIETKISNETRTFTGRDVKVANGRVIFIDSTTGLQTSVPDGIIRRPVAK